MKLYFQRRHIFEHNSGIVDLQYINKSGDTDYSVGQRIVVKTDDVLYLIDIIRRLALGLLKLTK